MTLPLLVILLIALVVLVLWWLLIRSEGVYLGQRVVIWLYDVFAPRYDALVEHDDVEEHLHLAQPLMERLAPNEQPLVLDVATGTGRLALALCQHARFEGHIFAYDRSHKMLNIAREKIAQEHFTDYVTFTLADGQHIPYSDDTFDCVACLEALEFMPQPEDALRELVRVLRCGGLLLTTLRINERLMPGRIWSREKMHNLLTEAGMIDVHFEVWQHDYMKVWAIKRDAT